MTRPRQLWVVGCSITHGLGVFPDQRYGQLVADHFGLPAIFLSQPGTSISWAADKILTSDINKDDIVLWGLTGVGRFTFAKNPDRIVHVLASDRAKLDEVSEFISEKYMVSYDLFYRAKQAINQVDNFLTKVGATLRLGFLPLNPVSYDMLMHDFLKNHPTTVYLYDIHSQEQIFLDLAVDKMHPGPLTHRSYADKFISSLEATV